MPFDSIPPQLRDTLVGFALLALYGLIGRLMHHARQVQYGRRRFFSKSLLLELPIAICCGIVGAGVTDWLDLTGRPATALVVTIAYLGPGFVEAAAWKVFDRLVPHPPAKGGEG